MNYNIIIDGADPLRDSIAEQLLFAFDARGCRCTEDINGLQFVLNLTSADRPRAYRRRAQSVFVISMVRFDEPPANLRAACYTTLIRSLSNLLIAIVPPSHVHERPEGCEIYFTTPEAGFYHLPYHPQSVVERIWPIATAQYSTANELVCDLPERYWHGSAATDDLRRYGAELDRLGVLPTPFPLREVLTEEELQHLYRIFGLTGISYGNLSVRERVPEFRNGSFWMTGRGVNKAQLTTVGSDMLLVRAFDFQRGVAHVSVPPEHNARARVSVDAVEHAMIYDRFADVGAIVHVHAWLDDIPSTLQNFPCGTRELAEDVAGLVGEASDPAQAAIGLKNHGITVTGRSLEDVFRRLRGNLRTEVPMFA